MPANNNAGFVYCALTYTELHSFIHFCIYGPVIIASCITCLPFTVVLMTLKGLMYGFPTERWLSTVV